MISAHHKSTISVLIALWLAKLILMAMMSTRKNKSDRTDITVLIHRCYTSLRRGFRRATLTMRCRQKSVAQPGVDKGNFQSMAILPLEHGVNNLVIRTDLDLIGPYRRLIELYHVLAHSLRVVLTHLSTIFGKRRLESLWVALRLIKSCKLHWTIASWANRYSKLTAIMSHASVEAAAKSAHGAIRMLDWSPLHNPRTASQRKRKMTTDLVDISLHLARAEVEALEEGEKIAVGTHYKMPRLVTPQPTFNYSTQRRPNQKTIHRRKVWLEVHLVVYVLSTKRMDWLNSRGSKQCQN